MIPWTAACQASLSSPTPRVYSNSCPLSRWCHPTISSSVVPFSSRPQSFPASGSFLVSQFFTSGGQSIGSFSFSISLSNEYSGLISFRMDWLDLLAVQGTLKSLLQWMYLLNTWIFVQLLSGVWLFATHGLQHARLPCPSPSPRVCSNSCPHSRWCHPTISFFVIPFTCLQSFPALGCFTMSQFFTSGGQSIGVFASASVLPMNIQDWFPLEWTGWISL